jgi:hypothetical protein
VARIVAGVLDLLGYVGEALLFGDRGWRRCTGPPSRYKATEAVYDGCEAASGRVRHEDILIRTLER